jgi:hypothetical protein
MGMRSTITLLVLLVGRPAPSEADPVTIRWRSLERGLEYGTIPVAPPPGVEIADRRLHLVRLRATAVSRLRAGIASEGDRRARTAAEWAKKLGLAVAINLGMYQGDHLTHVGYLRSGAHVNSRRWVPSYASLLAVGKGGARLLDREAVELASLAADSLVVQNLRLIRSRDGKTGEGVWSPQEKRWSEAALAQDRDGNLTFLFTRVPLSMAELNRLLLSLPLGIVRAAHLEGGPEASLSLHVPGVVELDLCGSFETGFFGSDRNSTQWPLPNILGVARSR